MYVERYSDWKNRETYGTMLRPSDERLFEEYLNTIQNDWVVADVGAGIGHYTVQFAEKAKKVYAVECHPETAETLRYNLLRNNARNVEILHKGISGEKGRMMIYEGETYGSTHLRPDNLLYKAIYHLYLRLLKPDYYVKPYHIVKVTTMDQLFNDVDLDLVKMDIQGAEYPAITMGMDRLIERCKPVLLIEIHKRRHHSQWEIIEYLLDKGYCLRVEKALPMQHLWMIGE